jgi:hypothetical protein
MNSCWNNEKCYEYLCTLRNSACAYYTFFSVKSKILSRCQKRTEAYQNCQNSTHKCKKPYNCVKIIFTSVKIFFVRVEITLFHVKVKLIILKSDLWVLKSHSAWWSHESMLKPYSNCWIYVRVIIIFMSVKSHMYMSQSHSVCWNYTQCVKYHIQRVKNVLVHVQITTNRVKNSLVRT